MRTLCKETSGNKTEDPLPFESNTMTQCSFLPKQPLVCDSFKICEGICGIAFL